MKWPRILVTVLFCLSVIVFLRLFVTEKALAGPAPIVITADIQAGIEKHIEEQARLGGGAFIHNFNEQKLSLKLVRVHTEYLANLGPDSHFACVDLATTDGDVYDVDFFLSGEPGNMTVTETTIHKFNGKPFYVWKQKPDKTWHRVAVEEATDNLLGVIKGSDEFDFYYRGTLPEMTENAQMWIPLASNDAFQTVEIKQVNTQGKQKILEDKKYGNKILFLDLTPQDSGKKIDIHFKVKRKEKGVYSGTKDKIEKYLQPERLVPVNDNFKKIAQEVIAGKKGDLVKARALYDHVIDRVRYAKNNNDGWGKGDATYACDIASGNCTDFHSYFIALARSVGIPARFAIGAAIPSSRNEGGVDGYHCWAEFYTYGKWWPVDISEADKCSSLAGYYFGRHPANRIELSRGRDLVVNPGPKSGPINFLAYPLLEVGGKPVKAKVTFSFERKSVS